MPVISFCQVSNLRPSVLAGHGSWSPRHVASLEDLRVRDIVFISTPAVIHMHSWQCISFETEENRDGKSWPPWTRWRLNKDSCFFFFSYYLIACSRFRYSLVLTAARWRHTCSCSLSPPTHHLAYHYCTWFAFYLHTLELVIIRAKVMVVISNSSFFNISMT